MYVLDVSPNIGGGVIENYYLQGASGGPYPSRARRIPFAQLQRPRLLAVAPGRYPTDVPPNASGSRPD